MLRSEVEVEAGGRGRRLEVDVGDRGPRSRSEVKILVLD